VAALSAWEIAGITTNHGFLLALAQDEGFARGETHTGFIAERWPEGYSNPLTPEALLMALGVAQCFGGSSPNAGASASANAPGSARAVDPVAVWRRLSGTKVG